MSMNELDIVFLMPKTKPEEFSRVAERYEGLVGALGKRSIENVGFAYQMGSYEPNERIFNDAYDLNHKMIGRRKARVVRDLTNQEEYDQPLYLDMWAPHIVNNPKVSQLLKDGVVLGVRLPGFEKLVSGDPAQKELTNVQKFRLISIGGVVIGAVEYRELTESQKEARKEADPKALSKDYVGFIEPSAMPDDLRLVADAVHAEVFEQTETANNVLAFDMVTGIAADDQWHKLWNVLRKPLRVSAWDRQFYASDTQSGGLAVVTELASRWDEAEAALLAQQVSIVG